MRTSLLSAFFLATLAAGCGGGGSAGPVSAEEGETITLNEVAELYRNYQGSKNLAPKKLSDFNPIRSLAGNGYESVRAGKVILRYGAMLPDVKEEPGDGSSTEVLAFFPQVPDSGGKVLMLDRTIKTMTADQFKAAKLAGTESSKPADAKK